VARRVKSAEAAAPATPPLDPFAALAVQLRLERLSREIAVLEFSSSARTARAHHLKAAVSAYGDLLDEACRMAGVPVSSTEAAPVRRLRQEAELRARGWIW
jgi:hypothetical protein